MKHLNQIKPFNEDTVTQEIAAEICAIACWNHLNEERFAGQFTIKNGEPKGVLKRGGGSCYPWDESRADLYIKTPTGVEIDTPIRMKVRIFETGNLISRHYKDNDYSEYDTIRRNKRTGEETVISSHSHMNYQVDLIDYYIQMGFYEVVRYDS